MGGFVVGLHNSTRPLVARSVRHPRQWWQQGVLASRARGAKTYTYTCFSGMLANHRSGFAFRSRFRARFVLTSKWGSRSQIHFNGYKWVPLNPNVENLNSWSIESLMEIICRSLTESVFRQFEGFCAWFSEKSIKREVPVLRPENDMPNPQ